MCGINFKNKFSELIRDNILDKNELAQLNTLAKDARINDKELARHIINDLNRFKDTTNLTYNLSDPLGKVEQLEFTITPAYSENEKIPGKNMLEVISNISQNDSLDETNDDGNRCAAGSIVNAYLLMGGSFDSLASKFSIDKELTYKNVHLAQEKIYDLSNIDDKPGIDMDLSYSYSQGTGKISDAVYKGELENVSQKIGIEINPLLGITVTTINNRSQSVKDFMQNNPNSVLQVGIYMNTKTGDLHSPSNTKPQNHSVLIFKRDDKFYLADTGTTTNGSGNSLREITKEHFSGFVENSQGTVHGLKIKK